MLPVFWTPSAEADLQDARVFYASVSEELSERFALAIVATVDRIADNPLQFPAVYRERRRAGVRRFPYGLFFEVRLDRIVVLACFHGRRNPRRWQSR